MLPEDVRALALLLPYAIEGAHMGHPDFRVAGRIFATLWTDEDRVVVRFTPDVQSAMTRIDPLVFEPVPGAWGKRGWTNVELAECDEETLRRALLRAWQNAAPPNLVAEFDVLGIDEDRRSGA